MGGRQAFIGLPDMFFFGIPQPKMGVGVKRQWVVGGGVPASVAARLVTPIYMALP